MASRTLQLLTFVSGRASLLLLGVSFLAFKTVILGFPSHSQLAAQ